MLFNSTNFSFFGFFGPEFWPFLFLFFNFTLKSAFVLTIFLAMHPKKLVKLLRQKIYKWGPVICLFYSILCLFLTYSRYAWLGLVTICSFVLIHYLAKQLERVLFKAKLIEKKEFNLPTESENCRDKILLLSNFSALSNFLTTFRLKKLDKVVLWLYRLWQFLSLATLTIAILTGLVVINLSEAHLEAWPKWLAKPSSTFWHAMRTQAALEVLRQNPKEFWFGFGLGASGPAAKTEYYPIQKYKLFRNNEMIAYKYRLVGEDLTIPENWFLQTILNGGFFYALGYLLLTSQPLWRLLSWLFSTDHLKYSKYQTQLLSVNQNQPIVFIPCLDLTQCLHLAMFTILVGNLFLHIWESQVIALYWTLVFYLGQANLQISPKKINCTKQ